MSISRIRRFSPYFNAIDPEKYKTNKKSTKERDEIIHRLEAEKKSSSTESFSREEKLRDVEKKLRDSERLIEKLNIENEQRILDKEQHTRTEQRRLQPGL